MMKRQTFSIWLLLIAVAIILTHSLFLRALVGHDILMQLLSAHKLDGSVAIALAFMTVRLAAFFVAPVLIGCAFALSALNYWTQWHR